MPPGGNAARRACTTIGVAGVAAGCAGMTAMLPGAAAGALGAIGIGGSGALARTLSPVAQPLFIASAILIILTAFTLSFWRRRRRMCRPLLRLPEPSTVRR